MKHIFKRTAAFAMAAAMTAGLLTGCGSKNSAPGGASSGEDGVTTLTWYMSINPVAADTDKVIEALNEYTREKIGVEIDYKVIANPDYKEKMPNLINAGEYFDICFTSNWTTDYLQFVGKDAFLDITELLPEYAGEEFQAVIAGAFLQDIAALPKTDGPVSFALAENQIVVTYQDTVFVNRRIEGNFPNYRQLLPDSHTTRVSMPVEHLVAGVKRASLLGQSSSPVRFDINIASQTTQLSSVAQDVGSAQETIACSGEGEDVEIAFNYAYLLDGLAAVGTDEVFLEVQSSLKPGIFKAAEPENFLYLVMPVRIA